MYILGIETSCDETAVAVIDGQGRVLSNRIASQIERHRPFGGVVPEIASREHLAHLQPLVELALAEGDVTFRDLSAVAVTSGPGLIGALLVGVAAAQGFAYARGLALAAVNHLEGHIFSPYLRLEGPAIERPERFWSLVVSGGHSSVYEISTSGAMSITLLNKTRDDAAGEVLDKVAKVLGMPYPGGPEIEKSALHGNKRAYPFQLPRMKNDSLDFSFSGLKSMAIRSARQLEQGEAALADFTASFQRAVIDHLLGRLEQLWEESRRRPEELSLAGGVAANGQLRERLARWCEQREVTLRLPEKIFCTDNAAMIAFAALNHGPSSWGDPRRVKVYSRAEGMKKGPPPELAIPVPGAKPPDGVERLT